MAVNNMIVPSPRKAPPKKMINRPITERIPVMRMMFPSGISLSSEVIKRETSTELKKMATKREDPSTTERVIGKYFMNSPMIPGHMARGTKAATVVTVEMMI